MLVIRPVVLGIKCDALIALLLVAATLRLAVTSISYLSYYHPDELFQYLEQAHRLDFGTGVVPWEYRYGIRSWLFPLLLALPMRLGDALSPNGDLQLLLPKALMALCSVGTVWSAYTIGGRISRLHALVAGFVVAVWFDFVLFAAHTLSESISVTAFIIAAAFFLDGQERSSRLVMAGMLFGAAAILRFQYLPAIGIFILTQRVELRRWIPLVAGGLAALLVSALTDVAMAQIPFSWFVENIRQNFLKGRSENFGIALPFAYLVEIGRQWSFSLIAIVPLMVLGARRCPSLFWAAAVNLAFHMLIPHKEYRFIFLTTGLFILLAGIGTGEALNAAHRRWPRMNQRAWVGVALFLWAAASANCAFGEAVWGRWKPNAPMMEAMDDARRVPGLCGIGIYEIAFWQGASYTVLHRAVPMYDILATDRLMVQEPHAALSNILPVVNALVTTPEAQGDIPQAYRLVRCHEAPPARPSEVGKACLYVRDGVCAPPNGAEAEFEINELLRRRDE
jgi:hypothetical protein